MILSLIAIGLSAATPTTILLHSGFITKIECEGRLLVSAVGDSTLVRLESIPKELGCGMYLKPIQESGLTNLFLETTTGSVERFLRIENTSPKNNKSLVIKVFGRSETK